MSLSARKSEEAACTHPSNVMRHLERPAIVNQKERTYASGVRPVPNKYICMSVSLTSELTVGGVQSDISTNPAPCKPNRQHNRDVKKQNEWLRENMFDSLGNYLYCSPCIFNGFGISSQRLAHQRNVRRRLASQPVIEMKKSNVEVQLLGEYVVMLNACNLSFMVW